MIAHGLAHSLMQLGMRREAEEVSYAWREPLVHNAILFIDTLAEDLTREMPVFIETERLDALWTCRHADRSPGRARRRSPGTRTIPANTRPRLPWFERAMAWYPKSATAMGYALTLQRLKRRKDVIELVNRYDGLFAEIVTLVIPDGPQRPPQACDPAAQADAHDARPAPPARAKPGAVSRRPAVPRAARTQDGASAPAQSQGVPDPVPPGEQPPLHGGGSFAPANHGAGWLREPYAGPFPQVARRVPGVGPMPYERYGFTLSARMERHRSADLADRLARSRRPKARFGPQQILGRQTRPATQPQAPRARP